MEEAANNTSVAGTRVPLQTLGLPTSVTAAMVLAEFQQYGLNPEPLLFAERPEIALLAPFALKGMGRFKANED